MDKRLDLRARNFPTAQEDAALEEPSRYEGPESAYRLAFTDTEFLLRDELRPVRMQLELLKPEMVQAEQNIASTIVIFGSARILPADVAARRLDEARRQGERRVDPPGRDAGADVALLRRGAPLRRAGDAEVARSRDADLRGHRRRPRRDGGRQPRRARSRRQEHRPEHRAAARTGAQPVHHARAVLPVPLLRAAQDALPDAQHRPGVLPRRLRHARRVVRGDDARADRQVPRPPHPALRARFLDPPGELRSADRDRHDRRPGRQAVPLRRDRRRGLGSARGGVRLRPARRPRPATWRSTSDALGPRTKTRRSAWRFDTCQDFTRCRSRPGRPDRR